MSTRKDPLLPNARIVARREFLERIRGRPFLASTVLLAALAALIAFLPVVVRLADRGTTTRIAVVADDLALAGRSIDVMRGVLNRTGPDAQYEFVIADDADAVADDVGAGAYEGAILAVRDPSGRLDFTFLTGQGIGADRTQFIGVATFAVAILEWTEQNGSEGSQPFQLPTFQVQAAAGPNAGGEPLGASEIASRQLFGTVLVVVLFLTIVIYGMWVAAGVAAEKETRVMELLISAASPRQLVLGKVLGIGLAGLLQYVAILVPAVLALAIQEPVARLLGLRGAVTDPLAGIEPTLFIAYGGFFVLGFTLYALIYAAAGSLVSRVEDLQVIALPMSLIGIAGYLQAVLALSGGLSWFIRFSSYVPFWSPFVMFTRLTVGRVEPWELVLAYGLLIGAIALVAALAIRVYAAGVILYGQRPGPARLLRAIVAPGD
ncbi:MAG TPA: ABC transporter permease [Candidatus Limnocylindrales bacterium]|nr:ABC transporter permease [Candidatus Limnocylindrales bacterium]